MNREQYEKLKTQSGSQLTRNDYENLKKNQSTGNNQKVPLTLQDGKEFGTISSNAYRAISNGLLDYYSPVDAEEKKVLEKFKNDVIYTQPVQLKLSDGKDATIKYGTIKKIDDYIAENDDTSVKELKEKVEPFLSSLNLSDDEYNVAKEYMTTLASQPKKAKSTLGGIVQSVPYLLEKTGAGILGAGEDIGKYALAGLSKLGSLVTTGDVSKSLDDYAGKQLEAKTVSDVWSESADRRYRVHDVTRDLATTFEAAGNMIPAMATEYFTGGVSPLGDMAITNYVAKNGAKTLIKTTSKVIKPSDVVFGLSAAGNAASVGYEKSKDTGSALVYGAASGLAEVMSERLFGGFAGTDIGDSVIDFTVKNPYIRKALNLATEPLEEVIVAAADPLLQRATVDKDAAFASFSDYGESAKQGFMLTALMGIATYPLKRHSIKKTVDMLNSASDSLNAITLDDSKMIMPLSYKATEEEMKQRQNEIKTRTQEYAEFVENEVSKFAKKYEEQSTRETAKTEEQTAPTVETATVSEKETVDTPIVAETPATAPVVETPTVTDTQRNTFTEELDEIASTEMPTVSVGETFIESGSNRIINVVGRDDAYATVEITTQDGVTETKTLRVKAVDNMAVDDKYTKVDTSAEPVSSPAEVVAENATSTTEPATSQAEKPSVKIGDVYRRNDNGVTYTITARDENKTSVLNSKTGKTDVMSNVTADVLFNNPKTNTTVSFTKVQDGNNVTTTEAENAPVTDESVSGDKVVASGDVDLAEGEILSLKRTKNIYSLFKGAKRVAIGEDCITDGCFAIPLTDKTLEEVKKVYKGEIETKENLHLSKLYNKDNDVIIQGNPKIIDITGGKGYVFKLGNEFYVCNQKYIDAFNNGKNVITANKNIMVPWTVHDKNGNFVALFMGAKKPTSLNDNTFENLQSVSAVLEADKQKKAEKAKVGLNRNELNLFKKAQSLIYGELNSQRYITNGHIVIATDEVETNAAIKEYEEYNDNRKAVEKDFRELLGRFIKLPEFGTVADIKTFDSDKKIVACVVNDIGFTFNHDYVNLIKKRSSVLKVSSDGTNTGTALLSYDKNGNLVGLLLPVRNDIETVDGLKMFTGKGLPNVEAPVSKDTEVKTKPAKTETVKETKPETKATEEVLQNQHESDTIEKNVDKESVDNGDSGEYDLSGENIGKDDGEKRNSREGDSERNIASSTDSKGKSDEIRTLDSGENDNKISDYEKGVVKKVYHGSAYKFEHFEKSYVDVGIHFGTKEQAVQRVGSDGILKECDLMLENPLECKDVFGERTPDEYVNDIIENSKLSENENAELKERYTTYCKNAVCLEMVDSLESKVASGKYQIDMDIDKDGVFVSISLMDDSGKVNQIPMAELISVDILKDVFGEKVTESLLQGRELSELAKSKLSSVALEFAANIEMNFLKLRKIEEILQSFGYDGFAYKNENEGDGWSYAVFDDSQIIRKTIDEEGVKNVEPQSEVLAGESGNDGGGLRSETSETVEQETTERVDGQSGENSGESLPQSTGTDGNRPDVGNDGEGVHGGNDADISESETTGNVEKTAEETPNTIDTEDKSIEKKRPSNKENFVITDDVAREFDNTPPSAEDNIKAIELLLTLENEGRPATADEKKILAKYKGWGGIDIRRIPWELSRKLYDLYDGQQLREMQSSQNNAFFTPTGVIDAMYNGLKRMGFKGGNVLESSMGVGNFFGRMPIAMTGKSYLTGVELESYTARIAQYLYPGATVINKPFQDVAIRNGSFDLVIGNVPFGTNKISYNKKKYSLHNYFIISSLDKVKDGGIVAVITSSGTLDSYGLDARKAIMDRADVVACYKLPERVFSRNANTDTTTDLLILKKRASDAKPSGDSILNVTTTEDGLRLNEYFVKHPENVLGTLAKGTNAWGEITTVLDDGNFYSKLNDAMKKLPKDLISGKVELKPIETIVSTSSKPRFFEKNGKIYADDGAGTATTITNASQEKTVRDYMAVRDAYKDLLAAYESDMSETDIKPLRDKLTKAYDNFSKKHDAITGDGKKKIGGKKVKNNTFLEADADYYLVSGLERYDSNEGKFVKSALFEKDTLRKKKVTSVDVASDALAVSLNESGRIDFARMSELTGKTEEQLIQELKGEIVLTPEGDYVLTDIYLSGNIYEKLEAVKDKPEFKEQKEMLEKVLPTPKDASSIMVKLGANYIDAKYVQDFSREVFNTRIEVSKNSSGAWLIEGVRQNRYGDILNVKYGCNAFNAIQLLEKVLNDSEITAKKTIKVDGKSVQVFDEKMTEIARQKAEDIKEAFENWIFRDSERRADIVDKYNRTYNNYRPLDYEHIAEKLSFDSMDENLKSKLYPHQKKGIARFLFGGNILFAHGVGTGKTFEMIASVMEAKRMGIVNKTAMVVPNNKVVDFKNDIAQAYPNAKVLVIDTANKKRQTMLGLVNSNDWDIVLIARTTFTKIPVGAELQSNYINQQLEELERQIAEAEQDRSISKRKLKGLYTQRDNLEQKLKDLDSAIKRDENSVDFEKLGFDCICVDEAHNYKSITTLTKLDIKGLASGADAQQANDMLMKLDYMRSIDGRIIFGTGTPITNTVSEIYNMMRMVRPDILEDAGIRSLDEWVNTFAKIETHTEIGIDNKVKNKSTQTIRSFVNGTEMVGMFRQFADVVFTQDVVKNLPKAIPVEVELEGTEELRQIESEISNTIASASGKDTLSAYTKAMAMANAAAIDLKMLSGAESDVNIFKDYSLEELEYENSKINTMCNYVYDEYKASNDIKGTQIIFCDGGAGSGTIYSFNVHNDIVQKLVERGIPENEIVIVKNQKDAQLEELFDKVNAGEVRVLIGTSRKMAEGLNVQKRVVAIHHPTVTFKPSDLEQGDARGVRAGNINKEVKIYRYLQGNTFDSYKWQAIDRKGEMINRALRGESVDELEDIGADDDSGAGVDAATAMAITSGNPLVKEKIDIDKEVKRLKNLKQNYMNEHYRYEDAVAKNPGQIRQLTEYAQRIEQDIALRNKYGEKASISIKDKTFTKQSDANKALIEAVKTAPKNGQYTKLGEYNGFDIMFKGDTGGMNYSLILKGSNEYSVEYAGNGNNIARIDGVLKRLDAELQRVQGKVERLKSDLEFAKQEVDKPFEKEKDLTEALEKQKDITYRYEHFGEPQSTEQSETEETESGETVHYSKQNAGNTSTEENKWVTERVESGTDGKRSKKDGTVNIADIVNAIREKFDIPIATGKVTSPDASAEYRERAESVRTRVANNLPSIAHELGHHLDKKYGLSKLDSVKSLRKSVSEEFLNQYPADEKDGEAVSEFVRIYLKSTNEANRLCPEFYNDFVRALSNEDLKSVNEIANAINEYMSYDIDNRYASAITNSEKMNKERLPVSERLHELRQKWIDPFLHIRDAVDYVEEVKGQTLSGKGNAYTLATNSLNATTVSNFLVTEGFRDLNGNIVSGAKSFLECISSVDSKDITRLDEYLVLRHSLEWIAPEQADVTKKRVFADDTLEDVERIEKRIAKFEMEHPEFKEAAENLYEYQNNVLKHFVIPTGAITEETLNTLNRKYPSYVPFYRAVGNDKSGKAKSTFANQKSPIKTAKGSGELIISPLESIIKNTEKMVKLSVRNQVADVLGNYADTVDGFAKFMEPIAPDLVPHSINITKIKETFLDELTNVSKSTEDYFAVSDLFETIFSDTVMDFTPIANANKKIVTVLRGGRPVYYQIHDDGLYKSIAELTPQQLDGFKVVDFVMNTMKLLITQNNPIFAATNLIRDLGTAYKLSPTNNPAEFMARYLKALTGVFTNSDEYKQYKAMGGGHSSELTANIENISKTLRKVAEKDMGKARRLAYAIFVHPVETAAMLNDKTESIARFAEFVRTLEAGEDLQQAIYNANDLTTNFRKQGAGGTAKVVNKLFLFNNAALQGLDKTARTLGNKDTEQRNKTWMKWLIHALIMGIVGYLYNKAVDDEGYENLSSYKKNNFYNFAIGDGKFISLPKPRENALLDSVTERAIEFMFGNDDAFYDFGGYLGSQLLPPMLPDDFSSVEGIAHSWLGSTVLGGVVDIGFNRDFKGTPIEGEYDKYKHSNEVYSDSSTLAAYKLGQTKLARAMDLSPKKIDHLISSYTGIIGQVNSALLPMNDGRRDATLGLRNKFISDSNYSTDLLNKAYDNKDKAELQWQYKDNIENAIEYEQNAVITSYISGMNKAIKALPEDEQRDGRKYLLKALNNWNYETTTQQSNMISRLENESVGKDYIFDELPSSEFSWTVNKQKYTYQMTPQEYNKYVSDYLKVIENARKQYGGNSLESYAKAKEAAKDYMSDYKSSLKGKYLNKATKTK